MTAPCGSVPERKMPQPKNSEDITFQDELRLRVMRVLEENPEASQRQIASELNVSLGGVNYCLKALVDRGLVKLGNFAKSDRKIGYAYFLTPEGMTEKAKITARFLKRKMAEYEQLQKEIEQLKIEVNQAASGSTK
jgi:EPS-associated MarR family transcriptional regulator